MTNTTTYLITGGNRGLGFELVKVLSKRANTVIITTTRTESKELTALAKDAGNITVLKLSIDDEQSVEEFGKQLAKLPNLQIDYFISNAGYAESYDTVVNTPRDSWIKHWTINTLGPIDTFKVVKPFLSSKNKLIFISTVAASIGGFDNFPVSTSAYGASKASLNFVVKELSYELKDSSIVVAVHPGVVSTDMGKFGGAALSKQLGFEVPSITPEASVESQLKIIDALKVEDNGKFFSYDGSVLPW